ncbi:MAG: prepilin-type N-terminal cleavage/methylation domain-containing protein [Eggerthellaceae bacterium]|uniref:Prepilin-type N-terminal cleavage/methylation domain-containing protein n=2 Tax=Eggerthellaceae TaxID=1643826 RepID=A0A7K0I990_9ACTN|nr:prepilin-type N-terminal cleavage/methylation domain-containing protein [Eggerthellaceae bacterium]MDN4468969.1 prepilin-type N-terminal cleavage/methylation domain-containing protein [Gordonibacter sp. RACS_AR68]MSA93982.1 prepilin-type N-terminal cleavage/methylation domain-containing protein [Gordonibacter urolithinfaciens]
MKEMIKRVREEKGGFTLAELLIVVAIVLVLVAIAVPVFTGALNNANNAVKNADIRSVKSVAATQILSSKDTTITSAKQWKAEATVDAEGNVGQVTLTADTTADPKDSAVTDNNGGYKVTAYIVSSDLPNNDSGKK